MTLTYFTARSTEVVNAFKWGKLVKCHLMGKPCWKWANGQNIYVYENILAPVGCLPLPWGYIHVYDCNIQTSSTLKPLGQSKPDFIRSILEKGEQKFI